MVSSPQSYKIIVLYDLKKRFSIRWGRSVVQTNTQIKDSAFVSKCWGWSRISARNCRDHHIFWWQFIQDHQFPFSSKFKDFNLDHKLPNIKALPTLRWLIYRTSTTWLIVLWNKVLWGKHPHTHYINIIGGCKAYESLLEEENCLKILQAFQWVGTFICITE